MALPHRVMVAVPVHGAVKVYQMSWFTCWSLQQKLQLGSAGPSVVAPTVEKLVVPVPTAIAAAHWLLAGAEDSGWEAVSISPPSPTPHLQGPDGAWSISPVDAHQRSESDRRRVVLTLRATNEDTASHYDVEGFYELVVDGVQYEHVCFDVIEGDQPLDPDSTHVALVGFSVPGSVATGELALDVDLGDGADRLALRADGS